MSRVTKQTARVANFVHVFELYVSRTVVSVSNLRAALVCGGGSKDKGSYAHFCFTYRTDLR